MISKIHHKALSAIWSGDQEGLAQSLANGALPNGEEGQSLLFEALSLRRWEMAEDLLKAGADPNAPCGRERAPLPLKLVFDFDEPRQMITWILERGGDANARFFGRSALEWTITHERSPEAAIFLRFGANPSERLDTGKTLLMLAAKEGNAEIVAMLLNAGANRAAQDLRGRSALDWARAGQKQRGAACEAAEAVLLAWEQREALEEGISPRIRQGAKGL